MATAVLNSSDTFPVGTTVSAYLKSNWKQSQLPPSGAPQGSSAASAVVAADGSLTLTGLTADQPHYAVAQVSGTYKYIGFNPVSSTSEAAELGYAEITADATQTTGTGDVVGLSVTFTAPSSPVLVVVSAPWVQHTTDQNFVWLFVADGSNNALPGASSAVHVAKAGGAACLYFARRVATLTPGTSYTWKVRMTAGANTASIIGFASIRVTKVSA